MKSFVLTFSIILSASLSFSQIVINSDDIATIGDIIVMANDTNPDPTIVPGPAGEDLSWDFSALTMDDTDTTWVVNPDWTQFQEDFPDANLAMITIDDSVFSFFHISPEQLVLHGMVLDISFLGPVKLTIEPGEEIAEFPVEYGNYNTQEIVQDVKFAVDTIIIDSMRIKVESSITTEIDSWGSMTIPMGTYDVIRSHETRYVSDSFWVHIPQTGWMLIDSLSQNYTTDTYNWWSNDPNTGFYIVTYETNSLEPEVKNVSYMYEPKYQNINENFSYNDINLYPNPFSSDLIIDMQKEQNAILQIFDLTGRQHIETRINQKKQNIDLSQLKCGFYFYRLTTLDNQIIGMGKVIKK